MIKYPPSTKLKWAMIWVKHGNKTISRFWTIYNIQKRLISKFKMISAVEDCAFVNDTATKTVSVFGAHALFCFYLDCYRKLKFWYICTWCVCGLKHAFTNNLAGDWNNSVIICVIQIAHGYFRNCLSTVISHNTQWIFLNLGHIIT